MTRVTNVGVDLTIETCWSCGITFGMPKRWAARRGENGKSFFCPTGCNLSYGESQIEKLRKQVEREKTKLEREREWHQRTRDAREKVQRSLTATKGVVTRIKNRVARGVCPCCQRSFPNLRRHMEAKHPDFEHEE